MAQNGNDDNYCSTIEQEQQNRVRLLAPGKQGYVDAPCAATFDIFKRTGRSISTLLAQVQPAFRQPDIRSCKGVCTW